MEKERIEDLLISLPRSLFLLAIPCFDYLALCIISETSQKPSIFGSILISYGGIHGGIQKIFRTK